jgi:7-cyano-7-deazaguanine reductase
MVNTDDIVDEVAKVNPLGSPAEYSSQYLPTLLFPIARKDKRNELGIESHPKFFGEDIWNAYEISWLNSNGLPQVAIGEFRFPASSPNIVESKSLKLYLNSFNQTTFESKSAVEDIIRTDLSHETDSKVSVALTNVDSPEHHAIEQLKADCVDTIDIKIDKYEYDPCLLELEDGAKQEIVEESLCSHLLKSNCLITNQPDWASIFIEYNGQKISRSSLLKYLVSFRTHNEFHEQCVERIYLDIMRLCQPKELTVYARYTRRGGLDINPWRSNCVTSMRNIRLSRQ